MIPDFLFSSPQSQGFFLLKDLVLSCSESLFLPLKVPFPSSPSSSVLSKSSPLLPDSRSRPLPSSSSSHPKTAERPEAVPPFGVWLVPKWNMTSSYLFMVMLTSVGSSSSHFTSGNNLSSNIKKSRL